MAKINKAEREQLKQKFGGLCAYCGCELKEKKWHADHIEPIYRKWFEPGDQCQHPERDTLGNLVPACSSCNISKATWSLENWRFELSKKVERLTRYQKNFRLAVAFGQVELTPKPIVFYFETLTLRAVNKYDWSNIPPQIQWLCTDTLGYVNGSDYEPKLSATRWAFTPSPNHISHVPVDSFKGSWRDSLEKRPCIGVAA